jgi:hypothetical protein
MARLDTRLSLYGEQRLSDAQVIALRAAARPTGLVPSHGPGWSGHDVMVGGDTVLALRRRGLLDMAGEGVVASERGVKIIAAIDKASARGSAPSNARSAP